MFKKIILKGIEFYNIFISPGLGANCRFYPSCSDYFHQAVFKYGVVKGSRLGFKRILKCNGIFPGGVDLP